MYARERERRKQEQERRRTAASECSRLLKAALSRSTDVRRVVAAIDAMGCHSLKGGIGCLHCDRMRDRNSSHVIGFYEPSQRRVVICCEKKVSLNSIERTVAHEVLHAYDKCFSPPFTCAERACSEVRAYKFSDCRNVWPEEKRRACVFAGAMSSLENSCRGSYGLVSAIFDDCYNDERPFKFSHFRTP